MLEAELKTAIALAYAAGELISDYYKTEFEAEQKLGADNFYEPVTAADRAASRLIVDALMTEFPDDGILSEEEADDLDTRLAARPRLDHRPDRRHRGLCKKGRRLRRPDRACRGRPSHPRRRLHARAPKAQLRRSRSGSV